MHSAPPGDAVLVSVHVPKSAGTSFRQVLEYIYGPRLWANYEKVFSREQAAPDCVPPGTAAIHGHFLADAFDDVLPRRHLVTWVRHPVERVASNYQHFLRVPDPNNDCCRQVRERRLSLCAFAELDWMRNETTRYMAGKSLADFAAVGIAERFTESLEMIGRALGWLRLLPSPRVNVNPKRTTNLYPLSSSDREFIGRLNAADLAFYEEAVAALERKRIALNTAPRPKLTSVTFSLFRS